MSSKREEARRQGADWLRYQTPDSDENPETGNVELEVENPSSLNGDIDDNHLSLALEPERYSTVLTIRSLCLLLLLLLRYKRQTCLRSPKEGDILISTLVLFSLGHVGSRKTNPSRFYWSSVAALNDNRVKRGKERRVRRRMQSSVNRPFT